jgi:CheY-like chemotaxis protein
MLMHSHHPYGMNFDEGPDNWVRPAIELPLYAGQETQARLPHDAARGHAEPVPLMIVDDNVDAARTLASLLEAKGHQVTVMANARSALDDSVRKPLPLYILDIGLPDIDGHELARRLRAFSPTSGAVLVALTGYGQVHDQAMALAAGFDHHFVKPIDIAALDRILVEVAQARQTVCG